MNRRVSRKSKPALGKPITWAISNKTTLKWKCPDQDHEMEDLSQNREMEKCMQEDELLFPDSDYDNHEIEVGMPDGKKTSDVDEDDGLRQDKDNPIALTLRNETTTEKRLTIDKVHDDMYAAHSDDLRQLIHTQPVRGRSQQHTTPHEAFIREGRTGISKQLHRIRAETRAIREETRQFLEDSDDEEVEYQREASIEKAEIRKIRAETRAIQEQTSSIQAETRVLINSKRAQIHRRERKTRYSL